MKPASAIEDRPGIGVLAMAFGVMMFTGIDTSAKWLIVAGMLPLQVVFARYLFHLVSALVWFIPREGTDALRSVDPKLQILRSVFLVASTVFNFYGMQTLPLTTIVAIYFAGPILTSLLAIPFLGEKVGLRRFLAILVGFGGVLIIVQPWGNAFQPAMLFSLAGISMASCYFIMTRKMAGREANSTAQIWASGLGTITIAPFALAHWAWPEGALQWAVFVMIGVFGFVGHALTTHAHRLAEASMLAPVVYLQVFFATTAGYLVFNTLPTSRTAIGALIIVASGLYIWNRERAGRARVKSPRPDISLKN